MTLLLHTTTLAVQRTTMLQAATKAIAVEKLLSKHELQSFPIPLYNPATSYSPISFHPFSFSSKKLSSSVKVCAIRRRRSNVQSDTYVLMEPGKAEEFVTEDELRARLKGWLENWPTALPPDLARFEDIDDAVSFLVRSVCELEIDGDVGSIQWFQVRLQ